MAEAVAKGAREVERAEVEMFKGTGINSGGGDCSRMPSENELAVACFQGRHLATIAQKLCQG